ncbi:amidohydrolase family protein [Geodermatophilus obscurus]|uniref:amidohydrolase family protein n=1 Tax=Geodermatophilus obscurus TaxID=1861 RepID=UPI001AD8C04D
MTDGRAPGRRRPRPRRGRGARRPRAVGGRRPRGRGRSRPTRYTSSQRVLPLARVLRRRRPARLRDRCAHRAALPAAQPVHRRDASVGSGPVAAARRPRFALPLADALPHATYDAAWSCAAEHERGLLSAGRRADFTVIDRNPFTEGVDSLLDAAVVRTVAGGITTHRGA